MEQAITKGDQTDRARALDFIEDRLDHLADLGTGAADAVPKLAELTHYPDPLIQRLAAQALRQIESKR